MGSSLKGLRAFPDAVKDEIGFALYEAQSGTKSLTANPLKGFGSASVLEIVSDYQTDTYRAIYTVKYDERIYVLHAFQKKSKKGAATPQPEIDIIKSRLKQAEDLHHEWKKQHSATETASNEKTRSTRRK